MQYDYEGVTEVRVEPGVARIEVVAKGQTYVINGIKRTAPTPHQFVVGSATTFEDRKLCFRP